MHNMLTFTSKPKLIYITSKHPKRQAVKYKLSSSLSLQTLTDKDHRIINKKDITCEENSGLAVESCLYMCFCYTAL